ncbi:MAG: protein kinase [Acidobacteria bacterium]|nr:protein kinase [Acidobacteriota bacterium]
MSRASADFKGTERFSIERRLGEGGFGVVYQAYDRKRNATVALKTLSRFDAAALYRFKQEFRSLADVTHPNLVTLYELLSDGEEWFFTMELIHGVNLLEYIREKTGPRPADWPPDFSITPTVDEGPAGGDLEATKRLEDAGSETRAPVSSNLPYAGPLLPVDRVRDAWAQLAEGVGALHEAGLLHRDIKPSNVLVTSEGRVVLLDFGLVAELTPAEVSQSVHIVGTPSYMSPEQSAGLAVSEASDWYSVGVMLYETLTGRLPFSGSLLEVLANKQKCEPPAPRDLLPELPEDLEDLSALCRDLLRRDPQARPVGREILRRLRGVPAEARQIPAPRPGPRTAPFVGRQRHLAALMEAFVAMKQGPAVTVYLHGKSGMGKSVLVRRFLDELRHREPQLVLLAGRCYERESVPYKALDSLMDVLSQYLKRLPPAEAQGIIPRDILALSRLFPVLREVEAVAGARRRVLEIRDSHELRRRAFAALRDLLARLADQSPVVLFIDDLQWGDLDSGALLAELLRPPDPPALLLIACYRSEEVESSPLLRTLLPSQLTPGSAADVRELEVGELTPLEAREVAVALLGQEQPASIARAEAIARESGGSPFFVDELVRYTQTVRGSERDEEPQEGEIKLEEVIQARVSRLPEAARRFLEVVAVAGQPLEMEVAKKAAALDAEEHPTVGLLRAGHLVRTRGTPELEEIETYHDRIRETVVARLSSEILKSHHHRLASALEASAHADPEMLAGHFQGAGDLERAAGYAAQAAGQAAEALAFQRAARLYRLAMELRPVEGIEARALNTKLGDALTCAGRGYEAAQAYVAAAEGAAAAEALELNRRAAEQLLISGHIDEGLARLRAVLSMVGMKLAKTPRGALLSLLARRVRLRLRGLKFHEREASQISAAEIMRIDTCWSVSCGLGMVDTIRGGDFQSRHLLLALRAGEPFRVARALAGEVGYSVAPGGLGRRRVARLLPVAEALAKRVNHPYAWAYFTMQSGLAAHLQGHFKKGYELCYRSEVMYRESCTGVAWEIDTARIFWVDALYWLGEWDELTRRVPVLVKEARERGDLLFPSYAVGLHVVHLAADDPEKAREEARRGLEGWSPQGFHLQHYWNLVAEGEIDLYSGRALDTWNRVLESWPGLSRSLLLRIQVVLIISWHVRARSALALAARPDSRSSLTEAQLLQEAERAARRIERERMPWGDALAWLVRAGVAASRGDRETAVAWLVSAEKASEASDMAHYAAAARRRRGELIGGDAGKALIDSADAWMIGQKVKDPDQMTATLAPGRWLLPG